MSKAYVQSRPDLANLAALNAAQVANPTGYVLASIVMTADGNAAICTDPAHASVPFELIATQS